MIKSPKLRKLLAKVNIEQGFGVAFNGSSNVNVFCPFHEDPHTSESKSCSVSAEGLFNCNGCNARGDVFDFYARKENTTRDLAISALKALATSDRVESGRKNSQVRKGRVKRKLEDFMPALCQDMLRSRGDFIDYLHRERGLNNETIEKYEIGCDERRITIPIRDADELLVNIRRYLPHTSSAPKMVSFAEGYGKPRLFPIRILDSTPIEEYITLCEGEWDALLLNQNGVPAIAVTAGVATWNSSFTALFSDRRVAIMYDVYDKDDLGQRIAWERARALRGAGADVRIIVLPLPETYHGGDVTNFLIDEKHDIQEIIDLISEAPDFEIPSGEDTPRQSSGDYHQTKDANVHTVTLEEASKSEFFYKRIKVKAIIAGKGIAPYLPPRHVSVEIAGEDGSTTTVEKVFDPWDGAILSLIQISEVRLRGFVRALLGVPKNATTQMAVLDTFNIEEIYVIPTINHERDQGQYVLRKCYYVGHGLQTNRVYELEGYTLPDPRTQAATHIFTSAIPTETDLEAFTLKEEQADELAITFRPAEDSSVHEKMEDIAVSLATHVTRIYGRSDLHNAVDLSFHSPIGFKFDGAFVRKGWLEILILGDTRTGKGFVTEGLCRHYRVGEVVSGENITLAGLVGGIQRIGDRWTLVWGKIPLADKRLIIMDEAGALSKSDIGRLSRIRSEGVAEVTKIISEKTTSRTRLIWLANPRPQGEGRKVMMTDYNYGIEAVPELIGAAEDVARFDFALIVAHNEVPHELINQRHYTTTTTLYTSDLCHLLVMWAWSRKPEQIIFSEKVTSLIMKMASLLAQKFSPKIPLIQGEDVRYKLARISASTAARVFSSDETHELLIVKEEHVNYAFNFLHRIYSRQSSGYDQMSAVEKERATLRDEDGVLEILQEAGDLLSDLVDGFLEHRQISARDICDYSSLDRYQVQAIISALVRQRALIKEYTWYVKKPAFKSFLQKLKQRSAVDYHTQYEYDPELEEE